MPPRRPSSHRPVATRAAKSAAKPVAKAPAKAPAKASAKAPAVPQPVPLKVPFAAKEEAKALARAAGGRLDFDWDTKIWSFVGPRLPESLYVFLPPAERAQREGRVTGGAVPQEAEGNRLRTYVLDVPYPLREEAGAAGARWDPEVKAHTITGRELPAALKRFQSASYSYERWMEDEVNGWATAPTAAEALAVGVVPRPHQREAVQAIAAALRAGFCGFLLADDVGLGKTISAWEAVRLNAPKAETVLIVCPLDVVPHWRRTIQTMGDGGKRVLIINYDRLNKLFEVDPAAKRKVKSRKGLARRGHAMSFDVVIADEAHRCKNPTTSRAKFLAKLVAKAQFTIWASATAGQNPLELSYLAPLLAQTTGSRVADLKEFEKWCQEQGIGVTRGAFGKWAWDAEGAHAEEDLRRVRDMLFRGARGRPAPGLRRRPSDIAGWPEINRILHPVELDAEQQRWYDAAWATFCQEMAVAARAGADPGKHPLVAKLRFRQKGSLLRVPSTVDLALGLLENGRQVAISVAFHETLDQIRQRLEAEGYACVVVHGEMSAKAKEAERLRFQRGQAPVCLFTVEEGISLHQGEVMVRGNDVPRAEIIHDLRWSAIQMAQIEGRCHRDGKFAEMYWAYAAGSVEEDVARVVAARVASMKGMLGDDRTTVREIEAVLRQRGLAPAGAARAAAA